MVLGGQGLLGEHGRAMHDRLFSLSYVPEPAVGFAVVGAAAAAWELGAGDDA